MPKQIKNKIETQGFEISILTQNQDDFISLTDIAKYKNADDPYIVISNWLSNYSTIDFLATWEEINNSDFNPMEFQRVRNERGRLSLTPKQWIKLVNAKGIQSKAGRYNGGTYAHSDIALEFASWVSPEFKLYVIKEFQRLKQSESYNSQIEWNVRRELTKANYSIHTDAIKEHLIPKALTKSDIAKTYASEADVLNVALFGMTARQFKMKYPEEAKKGNLRDNATIEQNIIMTNLENNNALLIKREVSQPERLKILREIAVEQLELITNARATNRIKKMAGEQNSQIE